MSNVTGSTQHEVEFGFEPLPAPFEDVLVKTHSSSLLTYVAYQGLPKRLIAVGIATRYMLKPKQRNGSRWRLNRAGQHFRRSKLADGRMEILIYINPAEANNFPGSSIEKVKKAFADEETRRAALHRSRLRRKFPSALQPMRERPAYLRLVVDNDRSTPAR